MIYFKFLSNTLMIQITNNQLSIETQLCARRQTLIYYKNKQRRLETILQFSILEIDLHIK